MKTGTWFPNADVKCPGSFSTVHRTCETISYKGQTRYRCASCQRFIGVRSRGCNVVVLQQHMPIPAKGSKCQRPSCYRRYADHTGTTHAGANRRCPNTALTAGWTFVDIGQRTAQEINIAIQTGAHRQAQQEAVADYQSRHDLGDLISDALR